MIRFYDDKEYIFFLSFYLEHNAARTIPMEEKSIIIQFSLYIFFYLLFVSIMIENKNKNFSKDSKNLKKFEESFAIFIKKLSLLLFIHCQPIL